MKKQVRFFTFPELLIVAVVFCCLAALVHPAMDAARSKDMQKACANNMKLLSVQTAMYMDEYNGMAVVSGGRGFYHWANFYGTKAPGIFKLNKFNVGGSVQYWSPELACPAMVAPTRDKQMASHTYGVINFRAYAQGVKARRWLGKNYYGSFGDPWVKGRNETEAYLNINKMKNISEFFLYAESAWASKAKAADGYGPYPGQAVNAFYLHADWSRSSFGVKLTHSGRANIAFADGHVASRSAKELKDGLMWVHSGVDGNGVYVKF